MLLQVGGGGFFESFLRGAQFSNQLLNSFMKREILRERQKQMKEQEKQLDVLTQVGLQELLAQQQQGQQLMPTAQNALQQAAAVASNAANQTPLRTIAPSVQAGVEVQRGEQRRERELARSQKEIRGALSSVFGGEQLDDAVAILTAPVPNETIRSAVFQRRFREKFQTDDNKIRIALNKVALARNQIALQTEREEFRQLQQQIDQRRQLQARASQLGIDFGRLEADLSQSLKIHEALSKDQAVRSAQEPFDLERAYETAIPRIARNLGVSPERVSATVFPITERFQTPMLGAFAAGQSPDEYIDEARKRGTLQRFATLRLTRRGRDQQLDDEELAAFVQDKLPNEIAVTEEAIRELHRRSFVRTRGFLGIENVPAPEAAAPRQPEISEARDFEFVPPARIRKMSESELQALQDATQDELAVVDNELQNLQFEIGSQARPTGGGEGGAAQPDPEARARRHSALRSKRRKLAQQLQHISEALQLQQTLSPVAFPSAR